MWDYVNAISVLDKYQRPKNSTFAIVEHLVRELRDFNLTIVTARCASRTGYESDTKVLGTLFIRQLSKLLSTEFATTLFDYDVSNNASVWRLIERRREDDRSTSPPFSFTLRVVFVCRAFGADKSMAIDRFECDRMFGDSDDDVSSCLLANEKCVPFRILRSPKSSYRLSYHPNLFYESIVEDSFD